MYQVSAVVLFSGKVYNPDLHDWRPSEGMVVRKSGLGVAG